MSKLDDFVGVHAEWCSQGIVSPCACGQIEAVAELAELKQWIKDLQSGMYVNCVYCGHRYGPKETTPVSMADALKEHIEQCPKHPMSALKARAEKAEAALEHLFRACEDLPLSEMDRMEKEISEAFNALGQGENEIVNWNLAE